MAATEPECFYPRSPEEAVQLLSQRSGKVLLLAGGTSASLVRAEELDCLVDLTRMGLDQVRREDGGWFIGCNVRVQQLASETGLGDWLGGMVGEAARSVASRPLRNMITVGGNAVQVFRWSDLPVVWLACEAEFELLSPQGKRRLTAEAFYHQPPRKFLGPAELLLGLHLPERRGNWGGAFKKLSRTAFDYSVVDAAALVCLEGDRCVEVKVAVGGTSNLPWRSSAAEQALVGRPPTAQLLAEAAAAAREQARVVADVRSGEDYRRRMVEVMVNRVLQLACQRASRRSD